MSRNAETQTVLNADRIRYWLSVGAQPSQKVAAILRRLGVEKPAPGEPWELPKPAAAPAEASAAPAEAPAAAPAS